MAKLEDATTNSWSTYRSEEFGGYWEIWIHGLKSPSQEEDIGSTPKPVLTYRH
jgi:hypothetical protein